jgi:hypothetical protein
MTQLSPELVTFNQGDARSKRHESRLDSSPAPLTEAEELPNVERGYDQAPANAVEVKQKTPEELLEQTVQIELSTFDGWMHFRVKNEIIRQMYESLERSHWQLDTGKVQAIIEREVNTERERYQQYAERMRQEQRNITGRMSVESEDHILESLSKDLKFLGSRKATYFEVAQRLEAVQSTGDDGYKDLTEKYAERAQPEASKEIIAILAQQKRELETKIGTLALSLRERDMELLDKSLDEQTTLQIISNPYSTYM